MNRLVVRILAGLGIMAIIVGSAVLMNAVIPERSRRDLCPCLLETGGCGCQTGASVGPPR